MRSVTLRIDPDDGFHPAAEAIARDPAVSGVAVHHVRPVGDGTVVLIYELRGDLDRARDLLRGDPAVLACDVVGDSTGSAYLRGEPTLAVASFLETVDRLPVVLEMPVELVDAGARFTFVGDAADLRELVDALPATFRAEVERLGEYEATPERLADALTPRQRAVVSAAVELGYYDRPRRATQADVARRLDVTPETVNEHLRAVESRVFPRLT